MVENSGTKFFYVQLSKMERVQDKRDKTKIIQVEIIEIMHPNAQNANRLLFQFQVWNQLDQHFGNVLFVEFTVRKKFAKQNNYQMKLKVFQTVSPISVRGFLATPDDPN